MNENFIHYLRSAKSLIASSISPSYQNLNESVEHISPILSNLEQVLFVFDLAASKISYMSENAQGVIGYSSDEMVRMGPEKYMELWHEKDFTLIINHVFAEGLECIKQIKDYDITRHRISFTYRLKQKDGSYKTMLNQFSHVLEDEERNPLVIMGTTSNISDLHKKNELFCSVSHQTIKGKWEKIYERSFSLEESADEDFGLTPREIEIIRFVHNGLSSKEIAVRNNRSEETIKSQRKSILAKTNCQSMTDVVVLAMKNGWI